MGLIFLIWTSLISVSSSSLIESWTQEADLQGLDADFWYFGDCPQFIYHLPSTTGIREGGILLHATNKDGDLTAARIHWEALQRIQRGTREIYFVVTCGGVSTATFVHSFLHKLSQFEADLSTSEKIVLSGLSKVYTGLSKVDFVWNEGRSIDTSSVSPWILAPIGTAQRGLWSGQVNFQSLAKEVDGTEGWARANAVVMEALDGMPKISQPSAVSLRSLHDEHSRMARVLSKPEPFWWRAIYFFYPRLFFFRHEWEWMLASSWVVSDFIPFQERDQSTLMTDYFFLGAQEAGEIEGKLQKHFAKFLRSNVSFDIQTVHFSPFLRSLFEGREAQVFQKVLESQPNFVVTPVISEELSESRFFREAGLRTFDLTPLKSSEPFFQMALDQTNSPREDVLEQAIVLEARILQDLVR